MWMKAMSGNWSTGMLVCRLKVEVWVRVMQPVAWVWEVAWGDGLALPLAEEDEDDDDDDDDDEEEDCPVERGACLPFLGGFSVCSGASDGERALFGGLFVE